MGYRVLQNSFNGGEVTPALYGRFDDQKYSSGAATVRNFICLPQGPVVNRPGFAYVNAAKYPGKKVRLIPFIYSSEQTMALEFGEKYIRFHTEGQTLVNEDGTPYEIATEYLECDLFALHYTQSADVLTIVHPSHPPSELVRYGPRDWRLTKIDFTLGIEAPTGLKVTFTSGDTSASGQTNYRPYYRITALKTDDTGSTVESEPCSAVSIACNLYINNSYNTLQWNAVAGASRYRVYKTYSGVYGLLGETENTSYTDTNFDTDTSITPPRLDDVFVSDGGIRSVTVTNGGQQYAMGGPITKILPGTFTIINESIEHTWTNALPPFSLSVWFPTHFPDRESITRMPLYKSGDHSDTAYFTVHYTGAYGDRVITVDSITIDEGGDRYVTGCRLDGYSWKTWSGTGSGKFGFIWNFPCEVTPYKPKVYIEDPTGRGAELEAQCANGAIVGITVKRAGSGYTNPRVIIDSEHHGGYGATAVANVARTGDYPSAVTYFQQRRVFAGSPVHPRMVWMTATGTESNFTYTIPAQADNRIRFEIAAQEAARVLHVAPLSSLIVLTGSSEFRLVTTDGGALTSETISVSPQASIGASDVQPVVVNSALIYAANRGGHIRELGYNYQAAGFTTGDLSVRAAHLFENVTTVDMARMKTPDSIIWFVMSDGKLLGLTYLPEQQVAAWHQHDTDGEFESVCCVPEGQEDALYAIVHRMVNGQEVRYIERMKERHFEKITDAFRVDCGATYKGDETTHISGLSWLEGKEVAVLADGGVLPNCVVKDGAIDLPVPVTHAHIGLPITAELKTLPAGAQMQDGSYGRGHMKNINKVFLRVYRSSGIAIGPDADHLTEMKMRSEEAFGEPPALVSEELPLAVSPKWTDNGQIVIRQTKPLPLTIVSWAADFAQ